MGQLLTLASVILVLIEASPIDIRVDRENDSFEEFDAIALSQEESLPGIERYGWIYQNGDYMWEDANGNLSNGPNSVNSFNNNGNNNNGDYNGNVNSNFGNGNNNNNNNNMGNNSGNNNSGDNNGNTIIIKCSKRYRTRPQYGPNGNCVCNCGFYG